MRHKNKSCANFRQVFEDKESVYDYIHVLKRNNKWKGGKPGKCKRCGSWHLNKPRKKK